MDETGDIIDDRARMCTVIESSRAVEQWKEGKALLTCGLLLNDAPADWFWGPSVGEVQNGAR